MVKKLVQKSELRLVRVDGHSIKFLEDTENVRTRNNLEKERQEILKANHLSHNFAWAYINNAYLSFS